MALWNVLSGAYLRHFSASVHDHRKQWGHREDWRRGYPGGRGPVGEEVVLYGLQDLAVRRHLLAGPSFGPLALRKAHI